MTPAPVPPGRARSRALIAFSLIAVPVAASALVLPAAAGAAPSDTGIVRAGAARQTPPPVADRSAAAAFVEAGYGYDDAVVLAGIWGVADPYTAKVKAGRYLAQDIPLAESPYAIADTTDRTTDELIALFLNTGHTYEDGEILAARWGVDVAEAKIRAGSELKAVGVLPHVDPAPAADSGYVPIDEAEPGDEAEYFPIDEAEPEDEGGPATVDPGGTEDGAVTAFFGAGYSYDDAVVLAGIWGVADPYTAKVKAGRYLAQDIPLAESPYAIADTTDRTTDELIALFLNTGHTYEDGEILAARWGVDVAEAKIRAGSELKAVGVLPFVDPALPGAGG